ncbi:YjjG family noncanonical pyrimidine nucleotidase [Hugenholtzia roseola]|uniref:YjjG family noncanonical pyrimidine nucleotidase n=1 Tax=Hugenholtzia roseola TaxID=1002 RepID=UPI000412A68C|nr:YjjG family noncanonical pyrimidine nucleotidase [Hugenholtzia roseola]
MKKITHLFFDLDHTLWDFDTNSRQTLLALYATHALQERVGADFEAFFRAFQKTTQGLWQAYNDNQIDKEGIRYARFRRVFALLEADPDTVPVDLESQYQHLCPRQPALMPYCVETLEKLANSGFHLHIITNGFEKTQRTKLKYSGILPFFQTVVTSECTGFKKPAPEIFWHALQKSNCQIEEALMIGDSLDSDIKGASLIAMQSLFYNPQRQTFILPQGAKSIHCLRQIPDNI